MRALVLLALAGCNDDRKRVAGDIFFCNGGSHTADFDCGDGFRCYAGLQSLGESVCVPECDPDDAKSCPDGVCTVGHECLHRCTVGDAQDTCNPAGGGILTCMRTTYSPIELSDGNDGVCVPAAFACNSSDDCKASSVFDRCTSETDGQQFNATLVTTGSICAQGYCQRDGVACEPGSTCVKNIIPSAGDRAPDVCAPNCQYRKVPGRDAGVEECPPGFGCLDTLLPQTTTRVCAPGFPGWLCSGPLGCTAGDCLPWSDVGGTFDKFTTCAPKCNLDDDCKIYDQPPGNPNMLSHFTCVNGRCRQLQSVFFTNVCNHDGEACQVDKDDKVRCTVLPGGADAGAGDDCDPLMAMTGGPAGGAVCLLSCDSDGDCGKLSTNSHATWSCLKRGPSTPGYCFPSLPFIIPCNGDESCIPGLFCMPPQPGAPIKVCTHACNTDGDCAQNPALGSNFRCLSNVCIPKTPSGCAAPSPDPSVCIAGQLSADGSTCLSPKGWLCDDDKRCLSGVCNDNKHCE